MIFGSEFESGFRLFIRFGTQGIFNRFRLLLRTLQVDHLPLKISGASASLGIDGITCSQGKSQTRLRLRLRVRMPDDVFLLAQIRWNGLQFRQRHRHTSMQKFATANHVDA